MPKGSAYRNRGRCRPIALASGQRAPSTDQPLAERQTQRRQAGATLAIPIADAALPAGRQ